MKTSDRRALREAAAVLDEHTEELHRSYTVRSTGEWPAGTDAERRDFNRSRRLATRLRTIADANG